MAKHNGKQGLTEEKQESSGQMVSRPSRLPGTWTGFPTMHEFREQMARMFEDFFGGLPSLWERHDSRWGLDIQDQEDAVLVRAEAPGFEADDFDLQLSNDRLVVRAERKHETEDKEGYRRYERQQFYRVIPMPAGIDEGQVDAQYRNGILTVTLPKTEQAKGKRIAVKS